MLNFCTWQLKLDRLTCLWFHDVSLEGSPIIQISYIVPVHSLRLFVCACACFFLVYADFSSSLSVPHCRVSHQCWLISCFDPVCLHVPAVDGDDDWCFMWHFSANNLLSYWFPAQIPCSALFQQMDIVPRCPPPYLSSFFMFLYFTEYLTWALRGFFPILYSFRTSPRLNRTMN